jgi:hypothetical protein
LRYTLNRCLHARECAVDQRCRGTGRLLKEYYVLPKEPWPGRKVRKISE